MLKFTRRVRVSFYRHPPGLAGKTFEKSTNGSRRSFPFVLAPANWGRRDEMEERKKRANC